MDERRMTGYFGAFWGITGILLLLGSAIYRLTSHAVDALTYEFHWYHWLSLLGLILFMAYAEGYRGFQQAFSPRAAARARYLSEHPKIFHSLLAPFFCMGFFHATKRRRMISISLTVGIILLILLVRMVPQPWRGIIDAAVVIGLLWGVVSLLIFGVAAFTSHHFPYSPEVPET